MKRRLFIQSGSAAVVAALSGCGGGGGGTAADLAAATGATDPAAAGAGAAAASPTVTAQVTQSAARSPQSAASSPQSSTAAATSASGPFNVGPNLHAGGSSTSQNTQIAAILQARNFKRVRMDYFAGQDQTLPRDLITKIRAYGGSVEASLQISYQWDHTVYTGGDLATIETNAYNQAYSAVDAMKDLVHDYELLNEITYRPECQAQVTPGDGQLESAYSGKSAFVSMAAVCRGMARAVHDLAANSGLPLRVILGTTSRDWGFLSFMQRQGVAFDVVGWHVYPAQGDASLVSDTWYGSGGPLNQLASFGKPVTINEFNAGEIYNGGYENAEGQSLTEQGYRSIVKHMLELYGQTSCNLEGVVFYELLDEPSKAAPENHFGLMFDLGRPKLSLSLATVLAGGTLSSDERTAITSRGLLTTAQIDAMQR